MEVCLLAEAKRRKLKEYQIDQNEKPEERPPKRRRRDPETSKKTEDEKREILLQKDKKNIRTPSKRKLEEDSIKEVNKTSTNKRRRSKDREEVTTRRDHESTPRRSARFKSSLMFFSNASASSDNISSGCKLTDQKTDKISPRHESTDAASALKRGKKPPISAKIKIVQSQPNPIQVCKTARKTPAQKSSSKIKLSLSNQPKITSFATKIIHPNTPLPAKLPNSPGSLIITPVITPNVSLSASQEPPQRTCKDGSLSN